MRRYLIHVTLQTGDTRDSPRSEVSEDAVAACSRLLDEARAGKLPRLPLPPALPECHLRVTREGRCTLATVMHAGAPVVTYAIASHSRCGGPLWRRLHDPALYQLATDPERPPVEPWLAVRLEPGVALVDRDRWPDLMLVLSDFGRCLAWAVLDPGVIH